MPGSVDALELHCLSRLSQQFSEVGTTAIVIGSDRDPDPVGRASGRQKVPEPGSERKCADSGARALGHTFTMPLCGQRFPPSFVCLTPHPLGTWCAR